MELLLLAMLYHPDVDITAAPKEPAPIVMPYDAESEELEAESTGGINQ